MSGKGRWIIVSCLWSCVTIVYLAAWLPVPDRLQQLRGPLPGPLVELGGPGHLPGGGRGQGIQVSRASAHRTQPDRWNTKRCEQFLWEVIYAVSMAINTPILPHYILPPDIENTKLVFRNWSINVILSNPLLLKTMEASFLLLQQFLCEPTTRRFKNCWRKFTF